jgi:hypothetical protein
MSGARRFGQLLARFEEVVGDNGGRMPLTQPEREAAGVVEGTPSEEDFVEAEESGVDEEAEVTKAGEDPHTSPNENKTLTEQEPEPEGGVGLE